MTGPRAAYDPVVARAPGELPHLVWVVSDDGVIQYANREMLDAFGWDHADQVVGRHGHDVLHHSHVDGTPYPRDECTLMQTVVGADRRLSGKDWLVRRDGTFLHLAWGVAPIESPQGPALMITGIDVTHLWEQDHLRRERAMRQARAEAMRTVQRRVFEQVQKLRRETVRDLHDGVQQRLVTLLLELRQAAEEPGLPEQVQELIGRSVADAQAAIDELRQLAAGLTPPVLASRGLVAAVDDLATRAPLPVEVSGEIDVRLPGYIETSAYFLVSEALTNAVKHACATQVRVDLDVLDHPYALQVTISDDGMGGADLGAGRGLTGLSERAVELGGAFHVRSDSGVGTTIQATLPIWNRGTPDPPSATVRTS